jgi:hypothetical protein
VPPYSSSALQGFVARGLSSTGAGRKLKGREGTSWIELPRKPLVNRGKSECRLLLLLLLLLLPLLLLLLLLGRVVSLNVTTAMVNSSGLFGCQSSTDMERVISLLLLLLLSFCCCCCCCCCVLVMTA